MPLEGFVIAMTSRVDADFLSVVGLSLSFLCSLQPVCVCTLSPRMPAVGCKSAGFSELPVIVPLQVSMLSTRDAE